MSLLLPTLLYWRGLTTWFQRDDFALLGLRDFAATGHSLSWALFSPLAQGTIRTLSERVYYMSLSTLFGVNALPFRIVAFLTFAATLVLLQRVCSKLTGSHVAGYCAAILWTVNSALSIPLSWSAEYYEILCAFFFVLDLRLLQRYIETGKRRFWIAQWVVFAAGFGVLELNVVYPALAAVYVWCYAPKTLRPKMLRKILPLFALSAAYMIVHLAVAPLPAGGPYKMYWDWHVLQTLATYSTWALGPAWLSVISVRSFTLRLIIAMALAAGLMAFLLWNLRLRQWKALFFAAWFIIVLSPLLPLQQHISYEYLTVPLIGLAMWAGAAVASGWQSNAWMRGATVLLLATYAASCC